MSRPAALRLDRASLGRLERWRVAGEKEEVCGLLIGHRSGDALVVGRVERLENLAADRRATFRIDPVAHVAAEDAARDAGLEVLGAWHTHPAGTPRPSRADRAGAWPRRVTLIGGRAGAWAAWWFGADGSGPRALRIEADGEAQRPSGRSSSPSTNSAQAFSSSSQSTSPNAAARASRRARSSATPHS